MRAAAAREDGNSRGPQYSRNPCSSTAGSLLLLSLWAINQRWAMVMVVSSQMERAYIHTCNIQT